MTDKKIWIEDKLLSEQTNIIGIGVRKLKTDIQVEIFANQPDGSIFHREFFIPSGDTGCMIDQECIRAYLSTLRGKCKPPS